MPPTHILHRIAPNQMELVFRHCPDFVGVFDVDGAPHFYNHAALALTGLSEGELLKLEVKELFIPEEQDFVTKIVLPLVLRDGGWEGELTFVNPKTNARIPVWFSVFRVDDPESQLPVSVTAVSRDLSRQKAKDAALLEAHERLEAVLTATEVGTWTYEIGSDLVVADRNLQRLFGVPDSDAVGGRLESYLRAVHPEDKARVAEQVREAVEAGSQFVSEYRLVDAGNQIRHVIARGSVERDRKGVPVRLPGVILDITEKVKAEAERRELTEALERQAKTVEAMVSSIADFTYIFDRRGKFVFVNKPLLDLWGLELENAVGKDFHELNYPEELAIRLQSQIEEVFRTGKPLTDKTPYTSPEGRRGFYEYILTPVFESDGSIDLVAGSTRDVTRDQMVLTALQKSEENFRSLAETLPDAVWAGGPMGGVEWTNSVLPRLTGLSLAQIIELGYPSLVHPDDLPATREVWQNALLHRIPFEIQHRIRHADGSWKWHLVRGAPNLNEDGQVERWIGTSTNIHSQIELNERLKRSEALFRQLSNTIPQLAWMARPDGEIFWYNQRWYDYTGTTEGQMRGNGWQRVHDPAVLESVIELWNESLQSGAPFDMTFPIRGADGSFRAFLTRVMPLRDEEGIISLWFGTNTDVSEEKKLLREREELLESERAARGAAEHAGRMKDEFLATLSHELRTPLNAIFGWTQILREDGGTDPRTLSEAIEVIDRNVRMQTQLIEDLLDMSRIISGKLRLDIHPVDPMQCILAAMESVAPAAEAKSIRMERMLDPSAGPVSADAGRIQQVIWNLLSNAIKFTPRGGTIHIWLVRGNSHIEISVADTGQGIAPEFLAHVFDRFRQGDPAANRLHGGLGLGLAIVKQLTELHGGSVHVASPGIGKGAMFSIRIPVLAVISQAVDPERQHPRVPASPPATWKSAALKGLKILVVDDEPDARKLVRRLLEDCQAEVTTAGSAAEAVSQIRTRRPDLLVSDIGMPETDGYQLLRILQQDEASFGGAIPAIALTAFARSEDRTKALLAGFASHVSKPVEPAELIATVASIARRLTQSMPSEANHELL